MNIERANLVLNKAILSLQTDESEAMAEAMYGSMAGGYRVPTPKSMGFKADRPKKEIKWKTKKLKMVTKSPQPWMDDEYHDVRVHMWGGWGVYKEPGPGNTSWKILHVPSGSQVSFGGYTGDFFKRKIDAQKVVETWIAKMPELFNATAAGLIVKNKKAMHDIAAGIQYPVKVAPKPNLKPSSYLIKSVFKVMPTNWGDVVEIREKLLKGGFGDFSLEQINHALAALKKKGKIQSRTGYGMTSWRLITKYNVDQSW